MNAPSRGLKVHTAEAVQVVLMAVDFFPHPGRVRAEIHSHPYDLHSLGGGALPAAARGIHRLLFVTHSIEEALVVGNRILLLSPHPGRVRAEIHSHQYDLHSLGGVAFQASARRIHRLLFDEAPEAERELGFADIRIAY